MYALPMIFVSPSCRLGDHIVGPARKPPKRTPSLSSASEQSQLLLSGHLGKQQYDSPAEGLQAGDDCVRFCRCHLDLLGRRATKFLTGAKRLPS